jgi:hypothetical protein
MEKRNSNAIISRITSTLILLLCVLALGIGVFLAAGNGSDLNRLRLDRLLSQSQSMMPAGSRATGAASEMPADPNAAASPSSRSPSERLRTDSKSAATLSGAASDVTVVTTDPNQLVLAAVRQAVWGPSVA